MKVVVTGSSGRIGRAIFNALAAEHEVIGVDLAPFSTTRVVGDATDPRVLAAALAGADAVIHTAGLHAPHVGVASDADFERINVAGTRTLVAAARQAGVRRLAYTSTTALYGDAVVPGTCTWITEATAPRPKTIYHRTKLAAEAILEDAADAQLAVRVIRMSRCFPEPADRMAAYRLHRGIDARDVADAHVAALLAPGPAFQRHIASGATPFLPEDIQTLAFDARGVLTLRCPELLAELDRRGWQVPAIDRVYDAGAAFAAFGWRTRHGSAEVLAQHDRQSLEVLPPSRWYRDRTPE